MRLDLVLFSQHYPYSSAWNKVIQKKIAIDKNDEKKKLHWVGTQIQTSKSTTNNVKRNKCVVCVYKCAYERISCELFFLLSSANIECVTVRENFFFARSL